MESLPGAVEDGFRLALRQPTVSSLALPEEQGFPHLSPRHPLPLLLEAVARQVPLEAVALARQEREGLLLLEWAVVGAVEA